MVIRRPIILNPCPCGSDFVTRTTDGISDCYNCANCGSLVGDMIIGAEP